MRKCPRNIVIDLDVSRVFQRKLLSGIIECLETVKGVTLFLPGSDFAHQSIPEHVDGVIGTFFTDRTSAIIEAREPGTPLVNLSSWSRIHIPDAVQVCADNRPLAKLCYRFLSECNLDILAYFNVKSYTPSRNRLEYLLETCHDEGIWLHQLSIENPWKLSPPKALVEALVALPKPAGIVVPADHLAPLLFSACKEAGCQVPVDIQIISVNDDARFCQSLSPSLTSIDVDAEQIGFRGAETLLHCMDGNHIEEGVTIPPLQIVQRESTMRVDTLSESIRQVVRFIHRHIGEPIEVSDLLAMQDSSRRTLEARFKREVGCSPFRYLREQRLLRACFLLKTTDLTISRIGSICGVSDTSYFCSLFRKYRGLTPQQYRETALVAR